MDVEAAPLARATKRAKIVLLGNPVRTVANAPRLAEELAMIDLISKGRLVPGWMRGAGSEQLAADNPPNASHRPTELTRVQVSSVGLAITHGKFSDTSNSIPCSVSRFAVLRVGNFDKNQRRLASFSGTDAFS